MTKLVVISAIFLITVIVFGPGRLDGRIVSVDNTGKLGKSEWKIKASRDGFGENLLGTDDNLPDPDGFADELAKLQELQAMKRRQPVDRLEKMLFKELNEFKNPKFPLTMQNYFALWRDYKRENGKKYNSYDEEKRRFGIFMQHHEEIRLHNIAYDLGLKTFSMKLNNYSDMDHDEFVRTMNGYKQSLKNAVVTDETPSIFLRPLNFKAPDEVDWRKKGYVTPVKDQGHCGSCWSFSATGSLEGQTFRKTGKLISLSEQNLVDCSWKYGDEGCNGGLMDNAFQYIKENHGVDTEASYPYEAKDGRCRFKKQNVGAMDVGYQDVESGDEDELKNALASVGPVSVAMDAGHASFQHYHTGIYFEPNCSSSALDHGVLAVGYGSLGEDKDFWLIKNSWGLSWGDKGYVKIARNRDNHCGIATQASYPVV